MAQTLGRPWDPDWHDKREICLRLLREAADLWAVGSDGAPSVGQVVAGLVRALIMEPRRFRAGMNRSFREGPWLSFLVRPEIECRSLSGHSAGDKAAQTAAALVELLTAAEQSWRKGHPEEPSTESVLREFFNTLLRRGAIRLMPRTYW